MNVQQIQLLSALLQLVGWTAPVVLMTILLFRINTQFGIGIGGARVLSGGVVMLLILLIKAFWQFQFGALSGPFQILSHGLLLMGSALVLLGAVKLFGTIIESGGGEAVQRAKKGIWTILILISGGFLAIGIAFAVIRKTPLEVVADYTLYNINIGIAACLYLAFGLLRLFHRTDKFQWSPWFYFTAGAVMLLDGMSRTYHMEFPLPLDVYLWIRAGEGLLIALFGTTALALAVRGVERMAPMLASASVKDSILKHKLSVQKRFVLVLVISIVVISATGYVILEVIQSSRHSIEETYLNEQRKVAESVAHNIEGLNSALVLSLKELAVLPAVQEIRKDSLQVLFSTTFTIWRNVAYSVSRIDEHGILRYVYPEVHGTAGSDISYQVHVKRLLQERDTIFSGVFKSIQGRYSFGIYVPLTARNRNGHGTHFAGAVAILMDMESYASSAFRNASIFTPNPLAAVNSQGRVIVTSKNSTEGEKAQDYLRKIFPTLTDRDLLDAVTKRISAVSSPTFIKVINRNSDPIPLWLVAHPVGFAQKPLGVIILPVSNDQIYAVYTETVGKQMILWVLFAVVLVLLMSTVVIIFYRWSRFLEEEVNRELVVVREAEGKYAKLFNEAVVGIFQTLPDGRLISANPSMAAMLGYESIDTLMAADVLRTPAGADRSGVPWDEIRKGAGANASVAIKKSDGSVMSALVYCKAVSEGNRKPHRYEGFIEDITERKRLEEQLIQAQKLEGLGTLAGGIAHDFNNLLAMILGSAELMRLHSREYPQLKKYVDRIIEASDRGASISRQLLIFSRPDQAELQPVSLSHIITELQNMLDHFLPKSVVVETHINVGSSIIMGDAGHLHQALLNLALNANDAMPEGGSLSISEYTIDFESMQKKFPSCERIPYVAVSVADTGVGIDESVKAKMFDPFFSTKERGKGTGLGLAIVHGIVKSHGGFIDVESVPKKGTTFTLYFPVIGGDALTREIPPHAAARGGHETILLVDDEEMIRDMLGEHLSEQGYSVLTAAGGKEALRLYQARHESIDIVITDLGMPELGGEELFRRLREINPHVKVMISSGYLSKSTKDHLLAMGVCDVLTKPYRLENIQMSLRSHLKVHE